MNEMNKARIYQFILEYKREHDGNSPTFREIRQACQISSTSMVSYYLRQLEAETKISLQPGTRSIAVVGGEWRLTA